METYGKLIAVVSSLTIFVASAQAVTIQHPEPFKDGWFVSAGITTYYGYPNGDRGTKVVGDVILIHSIDVFAATPYWHRLRIGGAVNLDAVSDKVSYDVIANFQLSKVSALSYGASIFRLGSSYKFDPFVGALGAYPINRHIAVGGFMTLRLDDLFFQGHKIADQWRWRGAVFVRFNVFTLSAKQ